MKLKPNLSQFHENEMFSRANDTASLSESNNSSVDWECDAESRSWSSSASWSDDVEGEATGRLWQQLEDIDSVLYGEASPKILPLALRQEVAQWRATFPHLRICGTKPPMGPRPTEEEGQEEVYASHGEYTEEIDERYNSEQKELQEQLRNLVMEKLLLKVQPEILAGLQAKSAKETLPTVNSSHREPLLTHRQSARKDSIRRQPAAHEPELGSILRVSPLPRRTTVSRGNTQTTRSNVVLPPIEPMKVSSTVPISVLGRQTRLVQPKSKITR
ncbi:Protein FAM149B1 [Frankliniella fusca]|uniref:Protein FAM149B1 n=1 Tax=Frankliniella fusca TaxID=407009 RepID=A0AAE1GUN5_9NEOP|nr:Protein FAM149B1 [Frankliniella fusca]